MVIHQPDGGLASLGRWLDFFLRITVNRPEASNLMLVQVLKLVGLAALWGRCLPGTPEQEAEVTGCMENSPKDDSSRVTDKILAASLTEMTGRRGGRGSRSDVKIRTTVFS